MEYLEQIVSLATLNSLSGSSRARITVFRNDGGYYLPPVNTVSFLIHTTGIEDMYASHQQKYEVELFKDFYVSRQLLSPKKRQIRFLYTQHFANENGYDNCLLLNDSKKCS
jgi:branched-chain amino acid aminotransferase